MRVQWRPVTGATVPTWLGITLVTLLIFGGACRRAAPSTNDLGARIRRCVQSEVTLSGFEIQQRRDTWFNALAGPGTGLGNQPQQGTYDLIEVAFQQYGFATGGWTLIGRPDTYRPANYRPQADDASKDARKSERLRLLEQRLQGKCSAAALG